MVVGPVERFMWACQEGNLTQVQQSDCLTYELKDDDENTGLHVAAANGHDSIVAFLLENGASVNEANRYGWTPLMQAARHGHTTVMNLLIRNEACINATSKLGTSALLCAVRSGTLSSVKLLFGNGASSSVLASELTPLMVAVQFGHNSIVRFLLENGSDADQLTHSSGLSALMIAASFGHKSTAQILVEHGANIVATNVCGKSALDIALSRRKKQVRGYLIQQINNLDVFHSKDDIFEAAKNGDVSRVQKFLVHCPSLINERRKADGATLLMLAAMSGALPMVQLLIKYGAFLNSKDCINGWTALMQALFHRHNDVALFIVKHGADICLRSNHGHSAFDIAILVGNVDTNLLKLLTFSALNISQSATALDGLSGSTTKKTWWNKFTGQFQKQRMKSGPKDGVRVSAEETFNLAPLATRVEESDRIHSPMVESKRTSSTLSLPSDIQNALPFLGTISPCRLAPPSNIRKPIVPPILPYYFSESDPGRASISADLKSITASSQTTALRSLPNYPTEENLNMPCSSVIPGVATVPKTTENLSGLLKTLSLEHYVSVFEEQEIDTLALSLLTENDLKELRIDSTVSRDRLMACISQLKKSLHH